MASICALAIIKELTSLLFVRTNLFCCWSIRGFVGWHFEMNFSFGMSTSLFVKTWCLRSFLDAFFGVTLTETDWLLLWEDMLSNYFQICRHHFFWCANSFSFWYTDICIICQKGRFISKFVLWRINNEVETFYSCRIVF